MPRRNRTEKSFQTGIQRQLRIDPFHNTVHRKIFRASNFRNSPVRIRGPAHIHDPLVGLEFTSVPVVAGVENKDVEFVNKPEACGPVVEDCGVGGGKTVGPAVGPEGTAGFDKPVFVAHIEDVGTFLSTCRHAHQGLELLAAE
ncbi:v-type ATP synthase alpha chain [Striga asiatica]|uniref:V-type ATP synthase alpha chain n=1 Tax=Striga asiatica TaxID=4170 RepID=A0A5A7Q6R0_STRAF|nr:v-type ATP synthase alpha chain [Striga asiatica]